MPSLAASAPHFHLRWHSNSAIAPPQYRLAAAAKDQESGHAPGFSGTHRAHETRTHRTRKNRAHGHGLTGDRTTESQSEVRASRGSAAPGSQSVVVIGRPAVAHSCGHGGARTELANEYQSTELSHESAMVVSGVAEKCKLGTVSAVRANPAFKRTAYGRRLTPR